MSDIKNYNPYNVDGFEIDIRETLTPKVKECYDACFDHIAKYHSEAEWELMACVTLKHKRIRFGIWREIRRLARTGGKKFSLTRALDGVDNPGNFHRMIKNPEICAYFFTKPLDQNSEAKILLSDSVDHIHEILKLPILDHRGKINTTLANLKYRIYKDLQDRELGQTVQRIQQHTVQETKAPEPKTIAEIDAELAKLERETDPELLIEAELVELSEDSQTGE
jgi:hypothetical protein